MASLFSCLRKLRQPKLATKCPIANLPIEINLFILQSSFDDSNAHNLLSLRRVSKLWNEFFLLYHKIAVRVKVEIDNDRECARIMPADCCNWNRPIWWRIHSFEDIASFITPRFVSLKKLAITVSDPENGRFVDFLLKMMDLRNSEQLESISFGIFDETPEIASLMNFFISHPIVQNTKIQCYTVETHHISSFSFFDEFLPRLKTFTKLQRLILDCLNETGSKNIKKLLEIVLELTKVHYLHIWYSDLLSDADQDQINSFARSVIMANLRTFHLECNMERRFVQTAQAAPRELYEFKEVIVTGKWIFSAERSGDCLDFNVKLNI